jgi:hypothetical protein
LLVPGGPLELAHFFRRRAGHDVVNLTSDDTPTASMADGKEAAKPATQSKTKQTLASGLRAYFAAYGVC